MTDPRLQDELRRYWDELVQGGQATPGAPSTPSEPDPALAGLIRQLHSRRDDVGPPDAAYAGQLRNDLLTQAGLTGAEPLVPLSVSDAPTNGRTQPRHRPREADLGTTRGRRSWGFGQLATVGLVLLVLGLIYFSLWPGRSGDRPAATVPPNGLAEETLLTATFPAETWPQWRTDSEILVVSILPGSRSTWWPTCCPGPMVEYVIEGAYTVRAQAPIRVVRANGAIEEVPAGTEVTLGPGDGLISRNETVVEAANTGTTPVTLLNWVMIDNDPGSSPSHLLPEWTRVDTDGWYDMGPPARTISVRLKRVMLPPKAELPLPPSGTLQFCVTLHEPDATGTPFPLDADVRTNGAVYNGRAQAITAYVAVIEFAEDPAGSAVAGTPPP